MSCFVLLPHKLIILENLTSDKKKNQNRLKKPPDLFLNFNSMGSYIYTKCPPNDQKKCPPKFFLPEIYLGRTVYLVPQCSCNCHPKFCFYTVLMETNL